MLDFWGVFGAGVKAWLATTTPEDLRGSEIQRQDTASKIVTSTESG